MTTLQTERNKAERHNANKPKGTTQKKMTNEKSWAEEMAELAAENAERDANREESETEKHYKAEMVHAKQNAKLAREKGDRLNAEQWEAQAEKAEWRLCYCTITEDDLD